MYMVSSTTATQTKHRFRPRPTSLFQSGWRPTDSSSIDQSMSFYGAPPSDVAVYLTTAPSRLIDDTEVRKADTTVTMASTLTAV